MENAVFWVVTPVALVSTNVPEECIASIIRVRRIGELGTTVAVTSTVLRLLVTANVPSSLSLVTLIRSVLTRATRRHTSEDDILQE
jgi:hypothetical protein